VISILLAGTPVQQTLAAEGNTFTEMNVSESDNDPKLLVNISQNFTLIEWDENRSCIKSIYGWYDTGRGEVKTGEDAELLARDFLIENTGIFKLDMSQLRLKDVTLDRRGMWTVDYAQYFHGVPVYRGEVRVLLTNKSVITDVFNDFHLDISIPTEPEISREEAVETVNAMTGENLTANQTSKRLNKTLLNIVPKIENGSIAYHLTWRVPTHTALYYVSAVCSLWINCPSTALPISVYGYSKGWIFPDRGSATRSDPWYRPFANQYVEIFDYDPNTYYRVKTTDSNGYYNSGSIPSGNTEVRAYLYGQHVRVTNDLGPKEKRAFLARP
jgi:hypothetical protein